MNHSIVVTVNDEEHHLSVPAQRTLLQMLRQDLGLTGVKVGCSSGECGACSVLFNDKVVNACLVLAVEADGAEILTVEGLAEDGKLHPLQKAFLDYHGLQCGFCTAGMLISAAALLSRSSRPDEIEIRQALLGNLCRCTGYADIIKAIQVASRARR